jgi:FdhD protein
VTEVRDGSALTREDRLATEEPLEIRLSWPGRPAERLTATMRTPGHDFELAAGFLFAEGILRGTDDLSTIAYCTDATLTPDEEFNVVTVTMTGPPPRPLPVRYAGPGADSSACGVCGKQSIEDGLGVPLAAPGTELPTVDAAVVTTLPDRLREAQRLFEATGGLHAAGLFSADGDALVVREDVGRHNALDKVVGARLLAGEPTAVPLLCVSGRLSFELVQKAVVAGIGALVAVGAPSSLAVQLAEQAGVCTAGFVRRDRFVVYSCPERLR